MTDPFADGGSGFDSIGEYEGELLLMTPIEYIPNIKTAHGDTDCIDIDATVLTGEDAGTTLECTRVFQKALKGSLKKRMGRDQGMLLARLARTENPRDKSKDAKKMWIFEPPSDDDKVIARKWLADEEARRAAKAETDDPFAS